MVLELAFGGLSYTFYVADGVLTTYPIPFDFLDPTHVTVYLNGVLQVDGEGYTIVNDDVVLTAPAIVGTDVRFIRITPRAYSAREVDFRSFGSITEDQMDINQKQIWLLIQEAIETDDTGGVNPNAEYISWDTIRDAWSARRNGAFARLGGVAEPSAGDDACTKDYADNLALYGVAGLPQTWGFTGTGSTSDFNLADGENLNASYLIVAINGVLQAPETDFTVIPGPTNSTLRFIAHQPVSGQAIVVQNFGRARFLNTLIPGVNSVTSLALQPQSVTTEKLDDGSVTTTKLADDAVTAAKLADAAVVTAHIADAQITFAKLLLATFAAAPGGTYPKFLKVATDGSLSLDFADPIDFPNWLTRLGTVSLSAFAVPTADRSIGGFKLTNVAAASSPTDAVNKATLDAAIGTSLGAKVDLLFQTTSPGGSATWTFFDSGTAPAWWSDAQYNYYTVVVSGLRQAGSDPLTTVRVQRGGAWETVFDTPSGSNAGTTTPRFLEFKVYAPRTPFTDSLTTYCPSIIGANGRTAAAGQFTGLRLVGTSNLSAGAVVQIYGHRSL